MFQSYFPLFLLLYEFFSYMSNDMYLPALVLIERDFATTTELVQMSIMVWYAGLSLPQLLIGAISDRFGRRIVLLSGGCLFFLATIGCALSTNITAFLVCRFLEGVGVCSLLVSGYAAIHESFDDTKAIQIIAWMGCITVLAPMFGPLCGGYFLLFSSWKAIFLFISLCSAATLAVLFFMMPETNSTRYHNRQTGIYRKLLSNRRFMTSAFTLGCLISVMIAWISVSPFLLMQDQQLSVTEFGWAQVPIFAAYAIATRLVGPLHKGFGNEKLFKMGFIVIVMAILLFVTSHYFSVDYPYRLLLPMAIYSFGFGLISAPLNRSVFTSTDEKKGTVTAMFYLIEMGTASVVTLSLHILPFFYLVPCIVTVACLSMLSNQRQEKFEF